MASRAKVFNYSGSLHADGSVTAEGDDLLTPGDAWTPEHLLLAAAARCVLTSLRFYARNMDVQGSADTSGTVTLRDDGRFGFVELKVALDVTIDPAPEPDKLPSLLGLAESGCFIGNSLDPKPNYSWQVNGVAVTASTPV